MTPVDPEYPPSTPKYDFEMYDFPTASSTIFHPEAPLDEGRSRTPIPEAFARGIGESSKVADTMGKSRKHVDDVQSDDQLEGYQVSQARVVPLKTADVLQITEPEDNGEGGSNLQKKFRPAGAIFPKFNTGAFPSVSFVDC